MIVLDASAAVDLLLDRTAGAWVADQVADTPPIHAPHLLDVEVTGVVRRLALAGHLSDGRAVVALSRLRGIPITRYAHGGLIERMWQLRHTVIAPDAAYVALAESLGAPLLTTDERLARAPGHTARILSPGTA